MQPAAAARQLRQCMRQLVRCATLAEALRVGFAYYHLLLHDFVPAPDRGRRRGGLQFVLRREPMRG